VSLPAKNKFDPAFPLVDSSGNATQSFRNYMSSLDALVAALAGGTLPTLINAANDAAAAAKGVAVGNMYRNGSVLMMRVA
jgi:hypothetical protein